MREEEYGDIKEGKAGQILAQIWKGISERPDLAHNIKITLKLKKVQGFFFFFFFLVFSRANPTARGGSQARGLIRAVATGLHYSHSNAGSKPHPQPTPQLTAMPDP